MRRLLSPEITHLWARAPQKGAFLIRAGTITPEQAPEKPHLSYVWSFWTPQKAMESRKVSPAIADLSRLGSPMAFPRLETRQNQPTSALLNLLTRHKSANRPGYLCFRASDGTHTPKSLTFASCLFFDSSRTHSRPVPRFLTERPESHHSPVP